MHKPLYPELIILLVLAVLTRFLFLFSPQDMVLDEYHFVNYSEAYLRGEYRFDIHPPLGKLVLAGFGSLINLPKTKNLEPYTAFPDVKFTWLRIVPATFGVLLALAVWLLTKELSQSRLAAFLAGLFVVLENGVIIQSRLILLDSMLWFLMLFGLWLLVRWSKNENRAWAISAFAAFGLAGAVKWTGLGALLVAFLWLLLLRKKLPRFLILAPIAAYLLVFAIHYSVTARTQKDGPWLALNLQAAAGGPKMLQVTELPRSASLVGQFLETHVYMALGNMNVPEHTAQSPWWSWPLAGKPFWYYGKGQNMLAFLPNLALLKLSTIAVIIALYLFFKQAQFRSSSYGQTSILLVSGWLANWLPFAFIQRPMFLYHYVPAFIFAIMLTATLIDYGVKQYPRYKYSIIASSVGSIIVSFLLTAPNTFLFR